MKHWTDFTATEAIVVKRRKHGEYSDNVFTFDIETSNLYKWDDGHVSGFDFTLPASAYQSALKAGFMIIWQFSVDGTTYYGRTWPEFIKFLYQIKESYPGTKIVYVHTLPFEFEFLQNITTEWDVFARMPRHPLKAYTPLFDMEFRCSYSLTNASLEKVPQLFQLPVQKQVGKWNYDIVRTPETPLSDDELKYAEFDCIVVDELIHRMRDIYGNVWRIPLTNTARLRVDVSGIYAKAFYFKQKIAAMNETVPRMFRMLTDSFAGGYTHPNADYTGRIIRLVGSYDIASSYPGAMVLHRYPWGRFHESAIRDITKLNPNYAYLIRIRFRFIYSKLNNHYIAFSHCLYRRNTLNDNGRIAMADELEMIVTDVDLQIILDSYGFDSYSIIECYCASYRYLDTRYIEYLLGLYQRKTIIKGDPDLNAEYNQIKTSINSMYGMFVTNTVRDDVEFKDGEWSIHPDSYNDTVRKLEKAANPYKTYLSYAWGVWVAAWGRYALWEGALIPCDQYVIYCDTDSVKYDIAESDGFVEKQIEKYNASVIDGMKKAMRWHGLPEDSFQPMDKKGNRRPMGVFEFEGTYDRFITWGAKKYAYEQDGKIHTVVSGVAQTYWDEETQQKEVALKSLEDFKPGHIWGYKESGRTVAYYNDNQPVCEVNGYTFTEPYGICIMPTTYELGVTDEYETFYTAQQKDHTDSSYLAPTWMKEIIK